MIRIFITTLITIGFLNIAVLAQETGFLQINGDPGFEIFLDGQSKGVTNLEKKGLLLQNIPAGEYMFKAVSDIENTNPDAFKIKIEADSFTKIYISLKSPEISSFIEKPNNNYHTRITYKTGEIRVKTFPQNAGIKISSLHQSIDFGHILLNIRGAQRNRTNSGFYTINDTLSLKNIPIGKYNIIGSALNKTLQKEIQANKNVTTIVMFNFETEEISVTEELPLGVITWSKPHQGKNKEGETITVQIKNSLNVPADVASIINEAKVKIKQLDELEISLNNLSENFEASSPVIKSTENEIAKIQTYLKNKASSIHESINEAMKIAKEQIVEHEHEYAEGIKEFSPTSKSAKDIIKNITDKQKIQQYLEEFAEKTDASIE